MKSKKTMFPVSLLTSFFVIFVFFITATTALATTDPIDYWHFNESSGNASDSGVNNITLTNNGSVTYTTGILSNAAQFNGSNYFSATGPDLANHSFSFSFWIYTDNLLGTNQDFFGLGSSASDNNALHLRVQSGGGMRLGFYANDLDISGVITQSNWYNILFTYDVNTGDRRVYVNNVLKGEDTAAPFTGNTAMTIGKSQFFNWNGKVDDFRIYDRVLTPDEVSAIVSEGTHTGHSRFKPYTVTRYGDMHETISTVATSSPVIYSTNLTNTVTPALQTTSPSAASTTPASTGTSTIVMEQNIPSSHYVFTKNLFLGVTDNEVLELQKYLNAHGYPIASDGNGSTGKETTYFGSLTGAALARFQAANNILPSAGYFGSITKSFINSKL